MPSSSSGPSTKIRSSRARRAHIRPSYRRIFCIFSASFVSVYCDFAFPIAVNQSRQRLFLPSSVSHGFCLSCVFGRGLLCKFGGCSDDATHSFVISSFVSKVTIFSCLRRFLGHISVATLIYICFGGKREKKGTQRKKGRDQNNKERAKRHA